MMMINLSVYYIALCIAVCVVKGAAIAGDGDVEEQGLYSKSDFVDILTNGNFERKVYRQPYALIVQFYNSYCGHCRAFMPRFKSLAADIVTWRNVLRLAVIDCSVEENNEICRQFEVMAYPSMRYLHVNYVKANGNVGEKFQQADTEEKLKEQLIQKLQSEQSIGRLPLAPSFNIASYTSYRNAMNDVPTNILYTFLVFENENSTTGSELALNLNNYKDIRVKRVYDTSELAEIARKRQFPAVIAIKSTLEPTDLSLKDPTASKLLNTINTFLRSKNYDFPKKDMNAPEIIHNNSNEEIPVMVNDAVYYNDLEMTLKTSLRTEITKYQTLSGEPLQALLDYLDVIITSFPFRSNLKEYMKGLRATILAKTIWRGSELHDTVRRLEEAYAPVYVSTNNDYIACKGSQPKYRGYTCGLWTLFHTLTVNAARKPGLEGPKVLQAMHGYIKHFFGCTDCSQHFQAMAAQNRIFDVKENDKAVLWLWIAHNEVNLRLAGDITEDPQHPKIQFPSIARCPACRKPRGAWALPAVYQYLQGVYGTEGIRDARRTFINASPSSPFSNLDIGMLSLLYMSV